MCRHREFVMSKLKIQIYKAASKSVLCHSNSVRNDYWDVGEGDTEPLIGHDETSESQCQGKTRTASRAQERIPTIPRPTCWETCNATRGSPASTDSLSNEGSVRSTSESHDEKDCPCFPPNDSRHDFLEYLSDKKTRDKPKYAKKQQIRKRTSLVCAERKRSPGRVVLYAKAPVMNKLSPKLRRSSRSRQWKIHQFTPISKHVFKKSFKISPTCRECVWQTPECGVKTQGLTKVVSSVAKPKAVLPASPQQRQQTDCDTLDKGLLDIKTHIEKVMSRPPLQQKRHKQKKVRRKQPSASPRWSYTIGRHFFKLLARMYTCEPQKLSSARTSLCSVAANEEDSSSSGESYDYPSCSSARRKSRYRIRVVSKDSADSDQSRGRLQRSRSLQREPRITKSASSTHTTLTKYDHGNGFRQGGREPLQGTKANLSQGRKSTYSPRIAESASFTQSAPYRYNQENHIRQRRSKYTANTKACMLHECRCPPSPRITETASSTHSAPYQYNPANRFRQEGSRYASKTKANTRQECKRPLSPRGRESVCSAHSVAYKHKEVRPPGQRRGQQFTSTRESMVQEDSCPISPGVTESASSTHAAASYKDNKGDALRDKGPKPATSTKTCLMQKRKRTFSPHEEFSCPISPRVTESASSTYSVPYKDKEGDELKHRGTKYKSNTKAGSLEKRKLTRSPREEDSCPISPRFTESVSSTHAAPYKDREGDELRHRGSKYASNTKAEKRKLTRSPREEDSYPISPRFTESVSSTHSVPYKDKEGDELKHRGSKYASNTKTGSLEKRKLSPPKEDSYPISPRFTESASPTHSAPYKDKEGDEPRRNKYASNTKVGSLEKRKLSPPKEDSCPISPRFTESVSSTHSAPYKDKEGDELRHRGTKYASNRKAGSLEKRKLTRSPREEDSYPISPRFTESVSSTHSALYKDREGVELRRNKYASNTKTCALQKRKRTLSESASSTHSDPYKYKYRNAEGELENKPTSSTKSNITPERMLRFSPQSSESASSIHSAYCQDNEIRYKGGKCIPTTQASTPQERKCTFSHHIRESVSSTHSAPYKYENGNEIQYREVRPLGQRETDTPQEGKRTPSPRVAQSASSTHSSSAKYGHKSEYRYGGVRPTTNTKSNTPNERKYVYFPRETAPKNKHYSPSTVPGKKVMRRPYDAAQKDDRRQRIGPGVSWDNQDNLTFWTSRSGRQSPTSSGSLNETEPVMSIGSLVSLDRLGVPELPSEGLRPFYSSKTNTKSKKNSSLKYTGMRPRSNFKSSGIPHRQASTSQSAGESLSELPTDEKSSLSSSTASAGMIRKTSMKKKTSRKDSNSKANRRCVRFDCDDCLDEEEEATNRNNAVFRDGPSQRSEPPDTKSITARKAYETRYYPGVRDKGVQCQCSSSSIPPSTSATESTSADVSGKERSMLYTRLV